MQGCRQRLRCSEAAATRSQHLATIRRHPTDGPMAAASMPMAALVRHVLDLGSTRDFSPAAHLLAGTAASDPRSRDSLGLCQFAAGRRNEGLANIVAALATSSGPPGLSRGRSR